MSEDQVEGLRALLGAPTDGAGAIDLARAYPWPDSGRWVRVMMVTTLDGAAAGPDGLSGSISSTADRAILSEVRRLSDVVLVGAGTIRAERYRPLRAAPAHVDERRALGLADAPVVCIVSASLDLPWDDPLFSESTVRPIVVTGPDVDPTALRAAASVADVMTVPGPGIDVAAMLGRLVDRGLGRIVCEGGRRLVTALAAADAIDEADIALSPLLVGGGRQHDALGSPVRFDLVQVLTADGFGFHRYLVDRRPGNDR